MLRQRYASSAHRPSLTTASRLATTAHATFVLFDCELCTRPKLVPIAERRLRLSSSLMTQRRDTRTSKLAISSALTQTWASAMRGRRSLKIRSCYLDTTVPTRAVMLLVWAGRIYIAMYGVCTTKSCVISAQGTRKSSPTSMNSSPTRS